MHVCMYVCMCPRLERPCSPPGSGPKIQAGKSADSDRKAELHNDEPLISNMQRASTTRSASILGPPGGTVPSRMIWDLPNRQTLQTHRSQHKWPTRLDLTRSQTLTHTSVSTLGVQHVAIDALPHLNRNDLDAHKQWFRHVGSTSHLRSNTPRATKRYAHHGFDTSDGGMIASELCLVTQSPTLPGHQTQHTKWFRHI